MAAASSESIVSAEFTKHILNRDIVSACDGAESTILLEGKVIVVGSMNTGKTSLILRLTRDEFSSATAPSLGVAYHYHTIVVPGCELYASIWDTAGYERFRALSGMYVRGAAAAVLTFDVSSRSSYNDLSGWRDLVSRYAAKGAVVAVAANKCDLPESKWQVRRDDGMAFARSIGASIYAETSAASGAGVSSLFYAIAAAGRFCADKSSKSASEDGGFKLVGVERGAAPSRRRKLNVYGGDSGALGGDSSGSGTCGCY